MAPPLVSVHLLLNGMAPFADAATDDSNTGGGGVGVRLRRRLDGGGRRKRPLDDVQARFDEPLRPTERTAPVGDLVSAQSVLERIQARPGRQTQRTRDALEELRQALQAAEQLVEAADRKRLDNRLRAAVLVALLLMN